MEFHIVYEEIYKMIILFDSLVVNIWEILCSITIL